MAFCQMLCVFSDADVCIRLLAGIFTRPAVAGIATTGGGWARAGENCCVGCAREACGATAL